MAKFLRSVLLGSGAVLVAAAAHAQSAPAPNEVSGVVVTAPRQEVKARQIQFAAPNIIDVQSAETIQKYPDFNAAEALGRIPGVSISTDTGEGRFVNIRGIDGNLAGATFGSVPLLNTFPGGTYFGGGGRAVEYDTIPTGAIDGLVVYKTTLPDHEAEGLGGLDVDDVRRRELDMARLDLLAGGGDHHAADLVRRGGRLGVRRGGDEKGARPEKGRSEKPSHVSAPNELSVDVSRGLIRSRAGSPRPSLGATGL